MAAGERGFELVVERLLDAPPEVVFDAWTDPRQVVRWWGPKGFTAPECEMDVRAAGAFRIRMRSPEGTDHRVRGVYREVVRPERLVFSWAWEGPDGSPGHESVVTVRLAAEGERTRLVLRHEILESAASRDSHRGGWTETLERLAAHVAGGRDAEKEGER